MLCLEAAILQMMCYYNLLHMPHHAPAYLWLEKSVKLEEKANCFQTVPYVGVDWIIIGGALPATVMPRIS